MSQTLEPMPNHHVENAGVRCRASTSPSLGGNARWIAIESAVRAAGRIVVWQLAADDVSTAMISSLSISLPAPDEPKTSAPEALSTSSEWFDRKSGPRTACAANANATKIATRMKVDSTLARPGVVFAPSHSSFTLAAVSQPQ